MYDKREGVRIGSNGIGGCAMAAGRTELRH